MKEGTLRHMREGDWQCIICSNFNFSFRTLCNRCSLISREQNEHQITLVAYNMPTSLTPLRRKAQSYHEDSLF